MQNDRLDQLTRILWLALGVIIAFMLMYLFRRWLLIPMMVALVLILVSLPLLLWMGIEKKQKAATAEAEPTENRKRDRIDAALHEMSDEELVHLRERISTGEVTDATLYQELFGEEGDRIYGQ